MASTQYKAKFETQKRKKHLLVVKPPIRRSTFSSTCYLIQFELYNDVYLRLYDASIRCSVEQTIISTVSVSMSE